jgi:uncharacterized protein with FMN-binding domain
MRKTFTIIFAVAILGGLSFYVNGHKSSGQTSISGDTDNTSAVTSTSSSANASSRPVASSMYKDGTYNGNTAETPYGTVQVAAVISDGKITDIKFLQMPSDEKHSQEVTAMSEPLLKSATLNSQNGHVDFVSGATSTSYGYQESLQAALDKAKTS